MSSEFNQMSKQIEIATNELTSKMRMVGKQIDLCLTQPQKEEYMVAAITAVNKLVDIFDKSSKELDEVIKLIPKISK